MHQTLEKAAKDNVRKKNQMGSEMQKELICKEVLQTLGPVKDLFQVVARNVYEKRWSVDVWPEEWKYMVQVIELNTVISVKYKTTVLLSQILRLKRFIKI